jgi:hypothetical protein
MIITYDCSQHDLRKRCYGCKWLALNAGNEWLGYCQCKENKVKNRNRQITDKACSWKNADKVKNC